MHRVALCLSLVLLGAQPALARGGYGDRYRPPAYLSPPKPGNENAAVGDSAAKARQDAARQGPVDPKTTPAAEWWRNSGSGRSDRARAGR